MQLIIITQAILCVSIAAIFGLLLFFLSKSTITHSLKEAVWANTFSQKKRKREYSKSLKCSNIWRLEILLSFFWREIAHLLMLKWHFLFEISNWKWVGVKKKRLSNLETTPRTCWSGVLFLSLYGFHFPWNFFSLTSLPIQPNRKGLLAIRQIASLRIWRNRMNNSTRIFQVQPVVSSVHWGDGWFGDRRTRAEKYFVPALNSLHTAFVLILL